MVQQLKTERQFRKLQDKLYKDTLKCIENNQPVKYNNLTKYMKQEAVILSAIRKVSKNRGAYTVGIDNKDINYYLNMKPEMAIKTFQDLISHYEPIEIRRKYIPKKNGKLRPLGIPTLQDRIMQEIIRSIIEPIMEAQFYKYSFGFRPQRTTHNSISYSRQIMLTTQYKYVVEGDIKGYFDNVDHNILIKKIKKMGIKDRKLLMIIKSSLKAGIMNEISRSEIGTPQGGILSPILANIYLHDFDLWLYNQWRNKKTKNEYSREDAKIYALKNSSNLIPIYYTRYADDWIIVTNSKENAEKLKQMAKRYLKENLKLELSEEKTLITDITKRKVTYLGIDFKAHKNNKGKISVKTKPNIENLEKQVKQINKNIKDIKKFARNKQEVIYEINKVNSQIRGVINYYEVATDVSKYLKKYDRKLLFAWGNVAKKYGGVFIPAKQVDNLKSIHENYEQKINAIKYQDKLIGMTSLCFCQFIKATQKDPKETPYTPEGREIRNKKLKKKPVKVRADELFNNTILQCNELGLNNPIYNVEYQLNRAYAYNRDKGKCKCCGIDLYSQVNTHHIDKTLPMNKINKVNNLATLCYDCHKRIHLKTPIVVKNKSDKKAIKINKYWKIINGIK